MVAETSAPRIAACPKTCYESTEQGGRVWTCRFHPNASQLACGLDDGRVAIFSAGQGPSTPTDQWHRQTARAITSAFVVSLDWNVDGTRLAAGHKDGTVVLWDDKGCKLLETKRQEYSITSITSDDGIILSRDGPEKNYVKGHTQTVRCLRWNADPAATHLFATGSDDKTAYVWDAKARNSVQLFQFHAGWIWDLRWISATMFVTCADDFAIKICRLGRDTPVRTFNHHPIHWVNCLWWNKTDARLASCAPDGFVKIWSLEETNPLQELRTEGSPFYCLDWKHITAGDGVSAHSVLASGSGDFSVTVWQLDDGAIDEAPLPLVLRGHTATVYSIAFSPDGRFLASLDEKGHLIIWSTQTWEMVFQTATTPFTGFCLDRLSWDPSSRRLAIPNKTSSVIIVDVN